MSYTGKTFIPRKIKVGYQNRDGTYTGKLAYVIYYDEKGALRKEKSWQSWRHNDIEPNDYNNEPLSGFVLNKKAGGYSTGWNHRQTYCRVYDPRGFEFEITIPNLLYILDNCNSIRGKGLEGEFVYAWDGTELLLIPTSAPDYNKLKSHSDVLFENKKFNTSNMILGATYLTKQGEHWIYLGRFSLYDDRSYNKGFGKSKGKYYFFRHKKHFETIKSTSNKIVDIVSSECVENYANLMTELEHKPIYSAHSHYEYTELQNDELTRGKSVYIKLRNNYHLVTLFPENKNKIGDKWGYTHWTSYPGIRNDILRYIKSVDPSQEMSIEELHAKLHFCKRNQILKNGNTAK